MQGGDGEEVSIEELASNLSTYKEQLLQVNQLLDDDPGNAEYVDMERELKESCVESSSVIIRCATCCDGQPAIPHLISDVIALTEELLTAAKENEISGSMGTGVSPSFSPSGDIMDPRSILDHQESFPVGAKVQAVWSEDGEWYNATIESHTANGYYVSYDEWGNKEEVDPANVRAVQEAVNSLLEAERVAEATKQAIKRKIAQAASVDFQSRNLPAKLRIEPDDPEDVKSSKRKKIHAFKSKVRLEQLEVTQNKRQNAWQQFQSTKGKTKKIGFFSGRKRESIFKSPEDPNGKVGVTGSGKGLTDFQKREKHLHLKGATVEMDDQ